MEQLHEDLKEAIIEADEQRALDAAAQIVAQGHDPLAAVHEGLSAGMAVVGDRFQAGEFFLPELIAAADTFSAAMEILEPEIEKAGGGMARTGVAVVGTVAGDVHTIGKDIFAMLLKVRGFEVHDLGADVPAGAFLDTSEKVGADLIAMSALLTTTMPGQKDLVDILREQGIRDRYVLMVGGGPVSPEWAAQIGADGYAQTAEEGVELAKRLVAELKSRSVA